MGRRADAVEAVDERFEDRRAPPSGATTSPIRTAMPTRSMASTTSAATSRNLGTGMTRTSSAKMSTTTRLSRTRSTTSVASVVQKGWARAAALESGTLQRRATM